MFIILQDLADQDPGLIGNLLVERLVGAHIDLVSEEDYSKIGAVVSILASGTNHFLFTNYMYFSRCFCLSKIFLKILKSLTVAFEGDSLVPSKSIFGLLSLLCTLDCMCKSFCALFDKNNHNDNVYSIP